MVAGTNSGLIIHGLLNHSMNIFSLLRSDPLCQGIVRLTAAQPRIYAGMSPFPDNKPITVRILSPTLHEKGQCLQYKEPRLVWLSLRKSIDLHGVGPAQSI
jgi:hypothetical protein